MATICIWVIHALIGRRHPLFSDTAVRRGLKRRQRRASISTGNFVGNCEHISVRLSLHNISSWYSLLFLSFHHHHLTLYGLSHRNHQHHFDWSNLGDQTEPTNKWNFNRRISSIPIDNRLSACHWKLSFFVTSARSSVAGAVNITNNPGRNCKPKTT